MFGKSGLQKKETINEIVHSCARPRNDEHALHDDRPARIDRPDGVGGNFVAESEAGLGGSGRGDYHGIDGSNPPGAGEIGGFVAGLPAKAVDD